ncbi:MAG TPA: hypothetical protein VMX15_03310 [Candidatus Heimdallarchaeota archaeon]|nr:hypothetical protein [Candidatus Heimdallarchaeota archaeon]
MTRIMREGFERGLRLVSVSSKWIAFIGTLIALIGTVFMTSVSFRPLYFIPEMLSRIDNREAAWATLTDFDDPGITFEVKNQIPKDERGFTELLRMIVARSKMFLPHEVTGIQISPNHYSSNGESWIGTYYVELQFRGQSEPFIVAAMSDVDGWIRDERLNWGIVFGFPVLMWGFVISLIAQFTTPRRKSKD